MIDEVLVSLFLYYDIMRVKEMHQQVYTFLPHPP
jgi:hypothetical protein